MNGDYGDIHWLLWILTGFSVFATFVHVLSIAVVGIVVRSDKRAFSCPAPAPVTIVRPIFECDCLLRETLESTFQLSYPQFEIILCAARADDPAVATARELIAKYPAVSAQLLIGDQRISQNPKLNNCVKGWEKARYDFIVFVDCNVLLPSDYLWQMLANWGADTGLVSSPPVGASPSNFWAEVECAFLNTYQGRWQLFANEINFGFAHGKNLMIRKSMLAQAGGICALASEPAEDAAATKLVRHAGLQVILNRRPFVQPLGNRTAKEVWDRQVRWARLRRASFPLSFLPEIFSGSFLPLCASGAAAVLAGFDAVLIVAAHALLWFGSEIALAYRAGWALSVTTFASMIIRDLIIPVLWLAAIASNAFEWRGHQMKTNPQLAHADEATDGKRCWRSRLFRGLGSGLSTWRLG
jgi:ceramide glucosyltransferase